MNEASMKKNASYVGLPILLVVILLLCYVYFDFSSTTRTALEGKESDKAKSLCVSSYEKEDGRLFNPQITEEFSSSESNKYPYGGVVTGKDSSGVPIDVRCLISKKKHGKLVVESISSSPTF